MNSGIAEFNSPTPDPMYWIEPPISVSSDRITMTAATATDIESPPVYYYFECTTDGDANSNWQISSTYVAQGLNPETEYTFRVKARDNAPSRNETGWSDPCSATTPILDLDPPEPDPMTWSQQPTAYGTSIDMRVAQAPDASLPVEYYFECTTDPTATSGWQTEPYYSAVDLTPETQYTFRVKARDSSPVQNTTGWSSSVSATTGMYLSGPIYYETVSPAARSQIGLSGLRITSLVRLSNDDLLACPHYDSDSVDIWRSIDNGLTWLEVTIAGDTLTGDQGALMHLLDDGSVLLYIGNLYKSTDNGVTWSQQPCDETGIVTSIVEEPNSNLLFYGPYDSWYAAYDDLNGTEPSAFLAVGEAEPHLLVLGDGRVLCTFARYQNPQGIFAAISNDNGVTWDTDNPVFLTGTWSDFSGWPTSIELPDGSIVTSFSIRGYNETTPERDSVAQVIRWRLPGDTGTPIAPATAPVFPEVHDYLNAGAYPGAATGFSADLQRITYWGKTPATRVRMPGLYKGALGRFPDGTLLASPWMGGVSYIYRSNDDGLSWTNVPTSGVTLAGKEQSILCLPDNQTVLLTTEGGVNLYRSTDAGVTWAEIDYGTPSYSPPRDLVRRSDGSIVMFNTSGSYWGTPPNTTAWRMRSFDNGATWTEDIPVVGGVWERTWPFFTEASFLPLTDDHILMATGITGQHRYEISGIVPPAGLGVPDTTHINESCVFTESFDGGLNWTPIGINSLILDYGDLHAKLSRLADGRLLCSYRSWNRMPIGVRAIISEDNGLTWNTDQSILLATSNTFTGGWQSDIQLPSGSMVTSWAMTTPYFFEVVHWDLPEPSDFYKADIYRDGVIDFLDLWTINQQWLNTGPDWDADINNDNNVNFKDFSYIAGQWDISP